MKTSFPKSLLDCRSWSLKNKLDITSVREWQVLTVCQNLSVGLKARMTQCVSAWLMPPYATLLAEVLANDCLSATYILV